MARESCTLDFGSFRSHCILCLIVFGAIMNDLERLISQIECVVPYVTATIANGNTFPGSDPEWIEVHKGRAFSSNNQLEGLLKLAQEIKAKNNVIEAKSADTETA